MARRVPPPVPTEPTPDSLRKGIARLGVTLDTMRSFDVSTVNRDNLGPLTALRADISRTIERTFGEGTSDAQRYSRAANISGTHSIVMGGGPTPQHEYQRNVQKDLEEGIALLSQAKRALENDLAELGETANSAPARAAEFHNKVFIVHGRSDGPKQAIARFLEGLGIEAIILNEQPSQSRSVIEKIEAFGDVDFAVVVMTPDDVGGLADATQAPRPRQNVLFELGYFIGKLGRPKVCVLRAGEMEMLSDYVGPIWVDFDEAGAWRQSLATELDAAGFDIDWNLVMRRKR